MFRLNDKAGLEAAPASLGATQQPILGLDQLLARGFTMRAIQKRAETGRVHRIYRGVYSLVPRALPTRDGLYMAAVLACGPGALLSHRSVAVLHGLREIGGTKIDVTVPARTSRTHTRLALHRSTTFQTPTGGALILRAILGSGR